MNRRGFLLGCLALGAAPAIVRAESLMKIVVPSVRQVYYCTNVAVHFPSASLDEIISTTYRAFSSSLIIQVYKQSPIMEHLLRRAA